MRASPKSLGTTVVSKWSSGRLVGPEKLSRSNKLDPDNFSSSKPISGRYGAGSGIFKEISGQASGFIELMRLHD